MVSTYVGTKIVNAEPGPAPRPIGKHPEGTPGYVVYYPDGYTSWSPAHEFERAYRPLSHHERQLMAMTNAEAAVARISDAPCEPGYCPADASGHFTHSFYWSEELREYRCQCGESLAGVARRG